MPRLDEVTEKHTTQAKTGWDANHRTTEWKKVVSRVPGTGSSCGFSVTKSATQAFQFKGSVHPNKNIFFQLPQVE